MAEKPGTSKADKAALKQQTRARNRRLWVYFRRYKWLFLLGAGFLAATNFLALRIPRELGQAVQRLRDAEGSGLSVLEAITTLVIGHAQLIILLAIGAGITRILSRITIFNAGRAIEYDLRNETFAHVTTLSAAYFNRTPTGDLTSRLSHDANYVRLLFGMGILHSVNTAIAGTMALSLMTTLDSRLTLYCIAPFPVFLYIIGRLAKLLHTQTRIVQEKLGELSAQSQEDLSGVAVIKAYSAEQTKAEAYDATCDEYVDENLKLATLRGVLFPLMLTMGSVGTLLVLWFGGTSVARGNLSLGEFIEFSGYVALLAWPIVGLGWVISVWHRGTAAFDRLMTVLATPADIVAPKAGETDVTVKSGRIEFKDVSFTYPGEDRPTLRDVDLVIESGKRVGIVGRSGAGKTTLVNLITRLYDVSAGEVRIDDTPISEIPLERLHTAVGVAPQEPFLFSTTVEKNVLMGLEARQAHVLHPVTDNGHSASSEEVARELDGAVEASQLKKDLKALPEALQTMVGERGITLSGGQKQRVALARAMLTKPMILILDDSLSSVDTRTERAILDHLERLMQGRTAIVITHRFSVLELLDEVLVLDRGRVVERGHHEKLVKEGGTYARMLRRQALREELSTL